MSDLPWCQHKKPLEGGLVPDLGWPQLLSPSHCLLKIKQKLFSMYISLYIWFYVVFCVWRYIKLHIRFLFTQWEVNENLHPPNLLLFSLHVNRGIVTFTLVSELKTSRKSHVCLTETGKMANTGNSIRHWWSSDGLGSDAVLGGGSIIKLQGTPGTNSTLNTLYPPLPK